MNDAIIVHDEAKIKSLKSLTQVVYILYALSYFTGITAIVGIIINYVKKEETVGTWLESHFRWQIRTFWFGLLWAVIGVATVVILVGMAILFANFCWIIYRIVKGWLNLNDGIPMAA
ncbi:MAG TPA: hypothetical protein VMW07_10085 [Gallionella sp.]|nr:hypothetical protein [Gallionella sp.]